MSHTKRTERESLDAGEILHQRYAATRRATEALCAPLAVEDYGLQAMPDTSPPKWHLAHTTWFFETFLLREFLPGYKPYAAQFEYLFNSYYEQVGPQFPRAQRGLLSRPTVEDIRNYRQYVDQGMESLLSTTGHKRWNEIWARTALGCHHEQQHQELLLTDIKYSLSVNPLRPAYRADLPAATGDAAPLQWHEQHAGIHEIGAAVTLPFAYDNETPRHRVLLGEHAIASRAVTNGEYLAFMEDGGYRRPEFWFADGWRTVRERGWQSPLYWEQDGGQWQVYTLSGMRPLNDNEPVCHVSYYEADAYARWAGKRLPTEMEWEAAAQQEAVSGNLRESGYLHPAPAGDDRESSHFYGDAWEWTSSAYAPYPGFRTTEGALGEYNGKFMVNQMVLRGGSCVTPTAHIRASYRNFFYPSDRWQFSGIRLCDDR